jgi:hypothetical protein
MKDKREEEVLRCRGRACLHGKNKGTGPKPKVENFGQRDASFKAETSEAAVNQDSARVDYCL